MTETLTQLARLVIKHHLPTEAHTDIINLISDIYSREADSLKLDQPKGGVRSTTREA